MRQLRSYHWWITGALFVLAAVLYVTGFGSSAYALVLIGFIVESLAWILIAFHPTNSSSRSSEP